MFISLRQRDQRFEFNLLRKIKSNNLVPATRLHIPTHAQLIFFMKVGLKLSLIFLKFITIARILMKINEKINIFFAKSSVVHSIYLLNASLRSLNKFLSVGNVNLFCELRRNKYFFRFKSLG